MPIRSPLFVATVTAFCLPASAFALALGDSVGLTDAEIRAMLTADGYIVGEIELEDGEIEIDAARDGQMFEITLSAETGIVTGMELDDDEDEDDQDDD